MAWTKQSVNASAWSLIGNNALTFSFQNVGQYPLYVNVTLTNVAPTESVGIAYSSWYGEVQIAPNVISSTNTGTYVWVRAVTQSTWVVYA